MILYDTTNSSSGYKIRLYVLKASGLTPMDKDMFGKPAKSDPYLITTLGKQTVNDRENAVDDVTDVDMYKLVEFNAELPGSSWLNIKVMDKNDFRSDGLIGQTGTCSIAVSIIHTHSLTHFYMLAHTVIHSNYLVYTHIYPLTPILCVQVLISRTGGSTRAGRSGVRRTKYYRVTQTAQGANHAGRPNPSNDVIYMS